MKQTSSPAVAAPKANQSQTLGIIGLALAFFIAPAGLGLSIVALVKARKYRESQILPVIGTVIGGLGTLSAVCILVVAAVFLSRPNRAEIAALPIEQALLAAGAQKVCTNGDAGLGFDNTTPWYHAYYSVADKLGLKEKVRSVAATQGLELSTDVVRINDLEANELPGQALYHPKTDYLRATRGATELSVAIERDTTVSLHCIAHYGEQRQTGVGEAIIDLQLTLPATHR